MSSPPTASPPSDIGGATCRPGSSTSDHARRPSADRGPDRAPRTHHRPVRDRRHQRPAPGGAAPERRVRQPDRLQERVLGRRCRGGGSRRRHVRDRGDLHPPRGRRAHRHLEHGGHHSDHRRLRDQAGQPDLVLPHRRCGLRPGRHGHRQLLDDSRHPGCGIRRDGERDGSRPGHRRGRGDLRRLLRRQDDPALGDHDPGAQARRRWADGGRARPQHVLDRGSRARHQPRHLPRDRVERRPDSGDQHRQGPCRAGRGLQHRVPVSPPAAAAGGLLRPQVPAVPVHPGIGAVRRHPGPVHAVGGGQGVRGRPVTGSRRHLDQGHLQRDGHRVRQQLRCRADRRVVHPGRDGEPVDHRLARAGCALVRCGDGARRIPPATPAADRVPRP